MAKLTFTADQFKKMGDPVDAGSKHIRYMCYANAASIPNGLQNRGICRFCEVGVVKTGNFSYN